ncbi:MAG: hypothetical protein DPW16_14170 [Chloroflexi bacterium]|nr:hypothetical protein [Chloroflexota bacterium]
MIENPTQALALLDELDIAAIVCDNNGRIEKINQSAQTLFHLFQPSTELIGCRLIEVDGLKSLALLDFSAPFYEGALFKGLFCRVRLKPVKAGGIVYTFEDLTDFYAHDQLRTDVLSMVVHDLRAPISAIKSFAELATQVGPINSQQQVFMDRVQQAVRSANLFLNDLLDMTWIDSGASLDRQPINIGYLVQSTAESLEERAKSHEVSLHISISPDLPVVQGEAHRLERVFTNLITNAIKYSGKGKSVYVTVSRASNYVTISVADNGAGISAEYLPFIFDRFYRVPGEERRKEGMGLGLAIVKAIVEKHGGHVEVQSEPGKGSTFMVVLPIEES